MEPDQESLLTHPYQERGQNHLDKNKWRKRPLLVACVVAILFCLAIYFYLNIKAFDGATSANQVDGPNRFKPLSRRKPMLDHESIFSDSGPSMLKLSDLLAHCIVAIQIAGEKVVNLSLAVNERLEQVGSKGETLEGANDVYTGADMQSHHIIIRTLKDSYPRLKVVSEEDTTTNFENIRAEDDILPIDRQMFAKMLKANQHDIEGQHADRGSLVAQHDTLVWIDPLDATKEYTENLTDYVTLMACIVHKSNPIAGVIYKPFTKQLFWSMQDTSTGEHHHSSDLISSLDLRKIRSHEATESGQLNLIVSRSHAGDIRSVLDEAYGDKANIISAGGSGYKTIEVIRGKADAYMHLTRIKKWDVCGPHAILHSISGANMTDLQGNKLDFGNPKAKVIDTGIIASLNSEIHRQLIELVGKSRSEGKNHM